MNIILVHAEEIQGNCVCLSDHRAKHIVKVLRAEEGGRLKIGCINGNLGAGEITSIVKKYPFSVNITVELNEPARPKPDLDLILALPRPIMLKRILSQVTALGVGTIHLINANRVEKSFWKASLLAPEEYTEHLIQGLEQAVDTRVPDVVVHEKFKPFIEDYLPGITSRYGCCICAHPGGDMPLASAVQNGDARDVLLAIGPEGGWVDFEVEKFRELQFQCCTLGDRILKVDTAVIAIHARITALRDCCRTP
jgi:RsmE family RNA methyltransferase